MKLIELLKVCTDEEVISFVDLESEKQIGVLMECAITEEGINEFKSVMNSNVDRIWAVSKGHLCIVVDNVKVIELQRFLNAAAGLCEPDDYDKWFYDQIYPVDEDEEDFSDIEEALYGKS